MPCETYKYNWRNLPPQREFVLFSDIPPDMLARLVKRYKFGDGKPYKRGGD